MNEINKKTKNEMVPFEEIKGYPRAQINRHQEIMNHLVFTIKLGEGFSRKAQYCAHCRTTDPLAYVTYINVVSIE